MKLKYEVEIDVPMELSSEIQNKLMNAMEEGLKNILYCIEDLNGVGINITKK